MSILHNTATDTTDDLSEALGEDILTDEKLHSFKKRTVSGALTYLFRSLLLAMVGIVASAVLSAYLGPEEFGIFGIVTQLVSLLQFFSDVGLGPSLIQKKEAPTLEEYRLVFTVQQLLSWSMFALIALLVLSGILTERIGQAGEYLMLSLAISFPLGSLKVISAIRLERALLFSKLVIPTIIEQLSYFGILMYLAANGWGLSAYSIAILVRTVLGVLSMFIISPWPVGFSFAFRRLRSLISTGLKFQAGDILSRVKDNLFYLSLGLWLPVREFGYINWSKSWSMYPYNLTVQNVIAVTFPAYSRLQQQPKLLARAIEKTIYFISLSIFPILVGMSVFIIPLTEVIERYHKWQPSRLTFILFTLSIAWAAISTPLTNTLNAIGKVGTTLKLMIFWTIATWVLTPLLIWLFGWQGVALAAFLISFTSILSVWLAKKEVGFQLWPQVQIPILASVVMAAVGVTGLPYWSRSLEWLLFGMLVTGLSYPLVVISTGQAQLRREITALLRG